MSKSFMELEITGFYVKTNPPYYFKVFIQSTNKIVIFLSYNCILTLITRICMSNQVFNIFIYIEKMLYYIKFQQSLKITNVCGWSFGVASSSSPSQSFINKLPCKTNSTNRWLCAHLIAPHYVQLCNPLHYDKIIRFYFDIISFSTNFGKNIHKYCCATNKTSY